MHLFEVLAKTISFKCPVSLFLVSIYLCSQLGCHQDRATDQPLVESGSALEVMETAIADGDWQTAWAVSDDVLIAHADDANILSQVARVASENGQVELAADLLVDAAQAHSLSDEAAVSRAIRGLVSVGRIFDGIELLKSAVAQHPDQNESLRWLFDFLIGVDDHEAAIPVGRTLVRRRKFDFELLLALSNTEKRELENESLEQMVSRNVADRRPRFGDAKTKFDLGKLTEAETILREILHSHPDWVPAQILLGRTLADSGQFDQLENWSHQLAGDYESHWGYWTVLGDWARFHLKASESARAYWEASQRNPDVLLVWTKLGAALNQLATTEADFPDDALEHVQRRIALLSRFYHQKELFRRSSQTSKAVVVEIAETLGELGRLWEAEAWSAMAMTLPDGDSKLLEKTRNSLVARLRRDAPWQLLERQPELQLDLAGLAMPSLGNLANARSVAAPHFAIASAKPDLRNEAVKRGLNFFGRTRNDLDKPGVLIYAELGCGGGSLDFDLDGWPDLYLLAAGGTPPNDDSEPNSLQRNVGGIFVDVTAATATGDTGFGQGVAIGDVNEDGFPDLFVLNYGSNRLLVNNGDGTFRDATKQLLPNSEPKWSTSGAIADIDGDGLSDIYVANYCIGFEPVTLRCVNEQTGEERSCAPIRFAGEKDVVLKGSLDGSFDDTTDAWDVQPSLVGRGLGVIIGSFDGTAGTDIFVANDMTYNHYWSRAESDEFRLVESAMTRGLAADGRSMPQGSMGIVAADLDRDGDIDFYVTNFEDEYNTYHQQIGPGSWADSTVQAKLGTVTLPMVGFGAQAVDFDNDGTLELAVTNGHVDFPVLPDDSPYAQPMQIFRRTPNAGYEIFDKFESGSYTGSLHVGRALWTIDANRDGQTDLVVTHQTEPAELLVNHTPSSNHWIGLRLVGQKCSRDAVGAVVELRAGGLRSIAALTAGDGYLCSNERVIRFGLGSVLDKVAISIRWADGSIQSHEGLSADADWLIVQQEAPFRFSTQGQ